MDIEKCHLQKDPANNIRNSVKKFAVDNNLAFFNPKKQSGFLRTLMIRNSNQGEFMVLIQFYRENKEQREAILNHLKDKFHLTALLYCINSKANDTLYDQEIIIYDGSEFITEVMEGLKFRVNAKPEFVKTINYIKSEKINSVAIIAGDTTTFDLIKNYLKDINNTLKYFELKNNFESKNKFFILCYEPLVGYNCNFKKYEKNKYNVLELKNFYLIKLAKVEIIN